MSICYHLLLSIYDIQNLFLDGRKFLEEEFLAGLAMTFCSCSKLQWRWVVVSMGGDNAEVGVS